MSELTLLTVAILMLCVALFSVAILIKNLWDYLDTLFDIAYEIKEDYYETQ